MMYKGEEEMENAKIELNENTVRAIKFRVMKFESDNAKTKEKSDKQMVDAIVKVIEEEVKCSLKN